MAPHQNSNPEVTLIRIRAWCEQHGSHVCFFGSQERDIAVAFSRIVQEWHRANGYSATLDCLTDDEPLIVSVFNDEDWLDDLPY